MHVLEFVSRTPSRALSFKLGPFTKLMAVSVRILFTSHDRCWSVGSHPYFLCHLEALERSARTVIYFKADRGGPKDRELASGHSPLFSIHAGCDIGYTLRRSVIVLLRRYKRSKDAILVA